MYDYTNDDGERLTIERPMTHPPSNPLRRGGKLWYRVWGHLVVNAATKPRLRDGHFTAHSLPRWDPCAPRHDAQGKPQFASRNEVREYLSKKSYSPDADHVSWGYGED